MVLDDFPNDEIQEGFGEFGVQIGTLCQVFQTVDLCGLAVGVRRGQVVFGLQLAHGLGVLEALAQGVDKDRVQAVDAGAVLFQHFGGE